MTPGNTAALLAATLVSVMACAARPAPPPVPAPAAPSGGSAPVRTTPAGIAEARADSLRRPWTAADVHFMTGMIPHHAQAIVMSRMAPTHGASAEIQRLAARIINAQQDEIHVMQQWLADRQQHVPEATPGKIHMKHHGMDHEMLMPGMLTDAQLRELDAARGKEFDLLFLRYMIAHHQGAVSMVRELFGTYGAGQDDTVFKVASDINVDQETEIERMRGMLADMLLAPDSR